MVSGVYRHSVIDEPSTTADEQVKMAEVVSGKLGMLHSLAIGPGLGRHPAVLQAVASVILEAKQRQLPLVIDADGLWLITQQPTLVKGCALLHCGQTNSYTYLPSEHRHTFVTFCSVCVLTGAEWWMNGVLLQLHPSRAHAE